MKFRAWWLCAAVLVIALGSCTSNPGSTSSSANPSDVLLPAPVDDSESLWGFVDGSGRWVIKPQFQDAYRFHDGLARVELNDKWGYVDESGKPVVEPRFTEAHDFSGGLARVATGPLQDPAQTFKIFITASDYGFIDTTGKMVIPDTWHDAGDFSEGLAAAVDSWGYLDTHGAWAVKPSSEAGYISGVADETTQLPARRFVDGFAPVSLVDDGRLPPTGGWSYIDKTGSAGVDVPVGGPLEIIDLTGRVVYEAPRSSGSGGEP